MAGPRPRGGPRGTARHHPRDQGPPQLLSNLQSLLLHSSPTIPQFGDHASSSGYFTLGDLWQSYEAWSAYGCEVPMRIQVDGVWQEVIQVYTPYLSGIQLFGADHTRRISIDSSGSATPSSSSSAATISSYCSEAEDEEGGAGSGDEGEESVGGAASDAASTASGSTAYTASTASTAASDSEDCEEGGCCGAAAAAGAARRLVRAAARGSVLQQQHNLGEPSQPLFEFSEAERPHLRAPLHDTVTALADRFPGLLTMDTRQLHPTSWFAVTWVPIYRIPSTPDPGAARDLAANFLTFHSLSVPVQRLVPAPQDLCSIAPLPPLLDPIGAAAVAWRTEVARQGLLASALAAMAAEQQQQVAAAQAAAAAAAACDAPPSPASPAASDAGSPLAAQLAAAGLAQGPAAPVAARAAQQLPLAATCLRPFAFMPYKASGRTWVDDWNLQRQHLPMIAAAGSWVERRKIQLPDFDFMTQMYRPLPTAGYGGGYASHHGSHHGQR